MREVKPCEAPCPKCGHADIRRVFRAKGSEWRCETYGRADNKFAGANTYIAKAWRDHIDHTCRCCGYRWQTLPLRKPHPTPQCLAATHRSTCRPAHQPTNGSCVIGNGCI